MRHAVFGLMAPMLLAACFGGGNSSDQPTAPVVSHDAFVASLAGAFIWNCTMTNDAGEAWQFVLANGASSRWTPVVLRQTGERFDQDVETRKFGEAIVYILRDDSEVLIAADGEARGEGQQSTKPFEFPQGQCVRGTQPAIA